LPKKFLQRVGPIFSLASAVDRDRSRTASGHCYGSTQCIVKFPNVYRLLTILGTLSVTTSESELVFFKLQRTLTSIRSTMTEDRLEALLWLCLF